MTTADTCLGCPGCFALAEELGDDQELLAFYRVKLLTRGWAGGSASDAERAYILAHSTWAQAQSERMRARHAAASENPKSGAEDARNGQTGSRSHPSELGGSHLGVLSATPIGATASGSAGTARTALGL